MPGFADFLDKVKVQAANVGQQASAFAQVRIDEFPRTLPTSFASSSLCSSDIAAAACSNLLAGVAV